MSGEAPRGEGAAGGGGPPPRGGGAPPGEPEEGRRVAEYAAGAGRAWDELDAGVERLKARVAEQCDLLKEHLLGMVEDERDRLRGHFAGELEGWRAAGREAQRLQRQLQATQNLVAGLQEGFSFPQSDLAQVLPATTPSELPP